MVCTPTTAATAGAATCRIFFASIWARCKVTTRPIGASPIAVGSYVTGLITAVDAKAAVAKIGPYRAVITAPDFSWTGEKSPEKLLHVGDLANLYIEALNGAAAKVQLEQSPGRAGFAAGHR